MMCVAALSAQANGNVRGSVLESKSKDAVIGAEVNFFRQGEATPAMSTFTDEVGAFELDLEPGVYRLECVYIDYEHIVRDSLLVREASVLELELMLGDQVPRELEGVVVVGTAKKNSVEALYIQQQQASTIGDGISADIMSKGADRGTGEVLKRVSGTSIQDNKYVIVRGMNDRYNIAMVDGSVLPSTEPNRKAFSFDIIPSSVLDQIIITKSGAADLPGDYSGGAIQILTKDIPAKPYTSISLGTGFHTLSTFQNFKSGYRTPTDIFGFDDGSRKLPKGLPGFEYLQDPRSYNPNSEAQGKGFLHLLNNDYKVYERKALPAINFQFGHGTSFKLAGERMLGINAAITYNHEERNRPEVTRQYSNFDYSDNVYSYQTSLGAMVNLGYYSGNTKILFKNLYNRIFDDKFLERTGANFNASKEIRYYAFDLQQKSLLKNTLLGEHQFDQNKLDWNLSYNLVSNDQPDQRKITYARSLNSADPFAADITNLGKANNRLFGSMKEHILNAGLNFSTPIGNAKAKFGVYEQARFRHFNNRYLGAVLNPSHPNANELIFDELESLYSSDNINNGHFHLIDQTSNSDMYTAQSFTTAAYGMLEHQLLDRLKMAYGLRAEHYFINLDSYTQNEVNKSWFDLLPSVNASYALSDKTNLRASYFRSLVRPELREMANMSYYDYELDAIITGNPALEPTRIHNLDLRYEHFPRSGEIFSASVFYKHFTNTIENNLYGSNSAYDVSTRNFSGGYNLGLELELRKNLGFLSHTLDRWSVYLNSSLVYSQITLPEDYFIQGQMITHRPLTGQSPAVVNAGLGYTSLDERFYLQLFYNYIGKNMYMVGNDIIGHVYLNARHLLDLTASYQFSERFNLKLSLKDMANSPFTYFMDQDVDGRFHRQEFASGSPIRVDQDWIWQEYKPGISVGLSASWRL